MKKPFFILVFFAAALSLSCKCGWGGNFLRVAPHEDLVVKARVLNLYKVHSDIHEKMEVEILSTFKGSDKRKRIMVWGDNGMLCRPYIDNFIKGGIYYLALDKDEGDYEISVCGEYYLQVKNKQVKMQKNEDDQETPKPMDLETFEKKLAEKIGK